MDTIRLSIEAPKKDRPGFAVKIALFDEVAGAFVAVKGAAAIIPADLTCSPTLPDPHEPSQALTAARVLELAAETPVPVETGLYLHRLLASGKLGIVWARLRAAGPLRLLLHVGPELALAPLHALPWERLRDESGRFIALEAGSPLVRWVEPAVAVPKSPVDDWPVRVLIVNAAEPGGGAGGADRIDAEAEMLALEQLLARQELRHDVEYDVLEHPSRQQIVEACANMRPHVLHVIGHARATSQGGELQLWQPASPGQLGFNDDWRAADIRLHLQGQAPRLVFLNACLSSAAAAGTRLPLASLTQAFLQAGSVATLGMQGEVTGQVARNFAETFYLGFIKGGGADIDLAVQAARRAVAGKGRGTSSDDDADWSFPVLTRCVAADAVLPRRRAPWKEVEGDADRFVSRLQQRREAHEAIRCCAAQAPARSKHLALIVGLHESGKSHLAKWTIQACWRAGMEVAYVPFQARDSVDWLDALRWIRDGQRRVEGQSPLPLAPIPSWPLKPQAFRAFNWALNQRLEGLPTFDGPPAEEATVADRGGALRNATDLSPTFIEETLNAFRDAAVACAGAGGLVLALDQIDGVDDSFRTELIDKLVEPVALGLWPGVRLLLVLQEEQWQRHRRRLDEFALQPPVVHVPYFRKGDFDRVARLLCHQWSGDLYEMPFVRNSLKGALRGGEEPPEWGVETLKNLAQLLQAFAHAQSKPSKRVQV